MNWLNIIGLSSDLVGVLLLGFDVIRIQKRLKSDAAERLSNFSQIMEENAGNKEYGAELATQGDWRHFDYDEGRIVPISSEPFDYAAAKESYANVANFVGSIGHDVYKMTQLFVAAYEAYEQTAQISLRLSYTGLVLISLGFALQIAGQF